MIRTLSLCLIAAAALCSSACCLPEAKVQWSPDGRWAAVLAPDGLYLSDADGALSPLVAPGVRAAAWTPDSKRLIVLRVIDVPTWKEAKTLLDEAQVRDVIARARLLKQEVMWHEGPFDKFDPKGLTEVSGAQAALMLLYLRDEDPAGLAEKLGEHWDDIKKATAPVTVIEAGDVAGGAVKFQPPAARTFVGLTSIRLSPSGRLAACVGAPAAEKAEDPSLWVVSVAGGPLREVADRVSQHPDWSADGQFVVYGRAAGSKAGGNENLRLGTISRRQVADAGGALLTDFGKAEDLAGLLFHDTLIVRCLGDGRILFYSGAVQLPCTAADLPQRAELFALQTKGPVAVGRVIAKGAQEGQPEGGRWFQVSPDQKRVLIQTPKGISIVSLADGRVESTIAESPKDLLNLPVWRTSDEVCLAVSAGSKIGSAARSEIVLWSAKGTKVLSKSWPDKIVKDMLDGSKGTPVEEKKPGEAAPAPASPPPTGPKPPKPAP